MKHLKKKIYIATFALLGLSTYTLDTQASCCASACEPALVGPMGLGCPSPDAANLNPYSNYLATCEVSRCRGFFGGFYVGAAYGIGNWDYHLEVGPHTPPNIDSESRSYLNTLFNGGFGFVWNHFYLGAELGYNIRSRTGTITYADTIDFMTTTTDNILGVPFAFSTPCAIKVDIRSPNAVTLDLMPGFVASRFMGYLRLGIEKSSFDLTRRVCFPSVTVDTTEFFDVTIEGQDYAFSQKDTSTGFRAGIGFAIAAGPHVSFNFDYIHTFGEERTYTPDVTAIAANPPVIISGDATTTAVSLDQLAAPISIEPQGNEFNFGVRFRF